MGAEAGIAGAVDSASLGEVPWPFDFQAPLVAAAVTVSVTVAVVVAVAVAVSVFVTVAERMAVADPVARSSPA